MTGSIFKQLEDEQARRNADKLPTAEEFAELSRMYRAAALGGGAQLNPKQCRMMSETFATLSVSVIATPKASPPPSSGED